MVMRRERRVESGTEVIGRESMVRGPELSIGGKRWRIVRGGEGLPPRSVPVCEGGELQVVNLEAVYGDVTLHFDHKCQLSPQA
jgi:hypothetical protein